MQSRHISATLVAISVMASACAPSNPAPPVEAPGTTGSESEAIRVRVDSARREIVATAGPFQVAASTQTHHSHSAHSANSPEGATLLRFEWPVSGWIRGFDLKIVDAQGAPLPRSLVHHLVVVNFDRRQLLYPTTERIIALSRETGSVEVPDVIGVPLRHGQRLGMYAVWRNDTGKYIDSAYLQLRILWTHARHQPRPIDVLPIYMDVSNVIGSAYDLPPGRSSKSFEFKPPIDGRLLGVSGHLHDYGLSVRLEDAETRRVLVAIRTKRDTAGRLTGIEQKKRLGFLGRGLRLRAGHRYRLAGEYDNPLGYTLRLGAMAHMEGVFVPSSLAAWPAIDTTNLEYQRDLALLLGALRTGSRAQPKGPSVGRH